KGRSLTCYSPVRRSSTPEGAFPHDLHVLSTPPAFVLSQDQTLQQKFNPGNTPTHAKNASRCTHRKNFRHWQQSPCRVLKEQTHTRATNHTDQPPRGTRPNLPGFSARVNRRTGVSGGSADPPSITATFTGARSSGGMPEALDIRSGCPPLSGG